MIWWRVRGSSLRLRLLLVVTGCVLAISAAALVVDLHREYHAGVARITASLREQASALQAARGLIPDKETFRRYVNQFCATMDEHISPGHGILVLGPDGGVVARASHDPMPRPVVQALLTRDAGDPVVDTGRHRLASVRLTGPDGYAFILAQYLDRIEAQLLGQVIRRAAGVLITAVVLIFLLYLATARWVLAPLDRIVLAARRWAARDFSARAAVYGPSDLRAVAREFNEMAGQLEEHEQTKLLELQQAREIQRNLLPKVLPAEGGLALAAEYRPAGHVAGDLYDVFELADGRTVVSLFDVSGHGLSAAMLTGVVKMSLRRHLTDGEDLSTAMQRLNHDIGICTADDYFATGCVGIWDPSDRRWTYCAAGHPGGVLVRNDRITEFPSTAPLLGVLPDGQWSVDSVILRPADRVFLYTDGVIETETAAGPFGLDGLRTKLDETLHLDLESQMHAIVQAVSPPAVETVTDDTTIIGFEIHRHAMERASAIG